MKKALFLLIALIILTGGLSVLAQGTSTVSFGLAPDSPFYFLKTWKENIQIFFTFGAENKAKQFLRLADVRLAEYQKMIEKGKTEIAQKTLDKYEKQLNNALQKIEDLKNKGKNVESLKQQLEEKKNQTANWKTFYGSAMGGFSIKYPNEFTAPDSPGEEYTDLTNPSCPKGYSYKFSSNEKIELKNGNQDAMQIRMEICSKPGWVGSFQKWIENQKMGRYPLSKETNFTEENILLGGKPATKLSKIYSQSLLGSSYKQILIYIYTYNDEGALEITTDINFDKQNIYLPIFNQMLSTFKFTGTSTNETVDWKTYKSEQYGFEIKYPNNFSVSISNCYEDVMSGQKLRDEKAVRIEDKNSGIYILICNFGIDYKKINNNSDIKTVKIDNHNTLVNSFIMRGGGRAYYYIERGNNLSTFIDSFWQYPEGKGGDDNSLKPKEALVNQMLSTFKFTGTSTSETADLKTMNKNELLNKLFPNLSFKNELAVFSGNYEMYLKDSVEGYFINNQEKNLLLIAQYDGKSKAEGFYHAYLGLFDKNGNLLTDSYLFPKQSGPHPEENVFYGFSGQFRFYDCKGIKYILSVTTSCVTGGCCNDSVAIFRVNNGKFEKVKAISSTGQEIKNVSKIIPIVNAAGDYSPNLKIILSDDGILIKKVPAISDNGKCPETDYKDLKWNENSCEFE